MPWNPGALGRALAELRADPYRSNIVVAEAADCDEATVRRARRTDPALAPDPELRTSRAGVCLADLAAEPPGHCDRCGAELSRSRSVGNQRRYCTEACRLRAMHEREEDRRKARLAGTAPEPEDLGQGRRWAEVIELPPPPDWSRGLCTTVLPSQRCWWTSSDRDEREAALRMCAACPIRAECEAWSMSLPTSDRAIYGGLTVNERQRRARSLRQAAHESALAKAIAAQLLAR